MNAGARERRFWAAAYAFGLFCPLLLMLVSPYTEDTITVFAIALGFVAFMGMALQVVIASRAPQFSRAVGLDVLIRLHRAMGGVLVVLVLVHVALIFWHDPWARNWLIPTPHKPLEALSGAIAAYSMLLIGLTSYWRARFRLSYERWRMTHIVLTILALLGGYAHVLYASDFSWSGPIRFTATVALLGAGTALVYLRVGRVFAALGGSGVWTLAEVRAEHGNATTLVLEHAGGAASTAPWSPGQFAWLRVHGRPYALAEHPFSIARSSTNPLRVEFTARALGDHTSSLSSLAVGTQVLVDGPHGGVRPTLPTAGWVLIVAGIGITPAMSVLRAMAESGDARPVQLVYGVRDWSDATFRDELERLASQLELELIPVVSRPHPESHWTGLRGRIDGSILAQVLPADRAQRNVLVCGPAGFATDVLGWLDALGIPRAHVHAERFTSA